MIFRLVLMIFSALWNIDGLHFAQWSTGRIGGNGRVCRSGRINGYYCCMLNYAGSSWFQWEWRTCRCDQHSDLSNNANKFFCSNHSLNLEVRSERRLFCGRRLSFHRTFSIFGKELFSRKTLDIIFISVTQERGKWIAYVKYIIITTHIFHNSSFDRILVLRLFIK